MANIQELNKLFVRVAGNQTIADISAVSVEQGNGKKIYFIEKQHTIVNNGIAYGIDPTTAQSLQDLIAVVGQSKLGQSGVDASTVVQRLAKLEAIKVNTASADYLNVSNGTGNDSPEIGVKIVGIETGQEGLLAATNVKGYIDASVKAAKTVVTTSKGLTVSDTTDATDKFTTYTVTPDLKIAYKAATTGDNAQPAKIVLSSTDDASVFGTVLVSDIIGNGVLQSSDYDPSTGVLTLTFKNASGTTTTATIDLHEMLDINDMSIANDSSVYLGVVLDGTAAEDGKSQAVFSAKIVDVSLATEQSTGLADAWQTKKYVDSKTVNLSVDGLGDSYIDVVQDSNNNKQLDVSAKIVTVTGTAGAVGTYTVADDGTVTVSGQTAPDLTVDDASGLLDGKAAVTAIKGYVDGKFAIEDASTEAAISGAVKALDADVSALGTNVSVGVTEVDGKLTAVKVLEKYATVEGTRSSQNASAAISITNPTQLVTGTDLSTLIDYTNDRIDEELDGMEVTADGDTSYIEATGEGHNVSVAAKLGTVTVTTPEGQDTVIAGTTGLVDASVMAANVSTFVNTRLTEEIAKLDSSITEKDFAQYVTVTTAISDGVLDENVSSVAVQYGSFVTADASLGIAKTNEVINYVDTYNFWEDYPNA